MSEFLNLEFIDNAIGSTASSILLSEVNAVCAAEGVVCRITSAWRSPSYTEQAPKSRHLRGLALDIDAVTVVGSNTTYSVSGVKSPDKYSGNSLTAKQYLDKIYDRLKKSAGYVDGERGNKKGVLWQVSEHYDHLHVSRLPDTNSTPQPNNTTSPEEISGACTDANYAQIGGGDAQKGRDECARCGKHQQVVDEITKTTQTSVETAIRKFAGFRKAFRYLEVFPELMVAAMAADANGRRSNAFGASPGSLSISGDIILPGINGLRVGELFWIDRVPAFYKVFGAFQVMSIEDTIGIDGWKTKINARFNYLGRTWKESMVKILT